MNVQMRITKFDTVCHEGLMRQALLSGNIRELKRLRAVYGQDHILLETMEDLDRLKSMEFDKRPNIGFVESEKDLSVFSDDELYKVVKFLDLAPKHAKARIGLPS